jgi:putative DNA primase/helicase
LNCRYCKNSEKKVIKGGGRGLTIPTGWQNRDSPIYLPEGASCTLAVTAMGLAAVGRPSNRGGVDHLVVLLSTVSTDCAIIVLGEYDSNERGDWPGRDGARETAATLAERLNRPVAWALPPDRAKDARAWVLSQRPDATLADEWQDLGDRFTAAINEQLLKTEPPPPEKVPKPREAADDPHRAARLFLWSHDQDLFHEATGVPPEFIKLRFWAEEWAEWDGATYRRILGKEVRARLTANIKAEFDRLSVEKVKPDGGAENKGKRASVVRKVTGRLVSDTLQALAGMTLLPAVVEPPTWISGNGPFPATEVLAARNALVHLPSLVSGKEPFSCAPTLDFFSFNALDYDFSLEAPEPAGWLTFLRELWPDDPESISTLQEWMGYLLSANTRQQKILLIVGPKRSGKGTIARVLTALLGRANVAGPTLSSLGTNFGLWPLLGKLAAVISDARLSGRTDAAMVIERLMAVSGEDILTIDRKNLTPVTTKLSARFVILTNELPRLGDASGALAGRMILLRLSASWYGREDTGLTDRLLTELPSVLLWAIAGWQRLRERGHFVQPESGKDLLGDLEDLSSPVGAFVRERCYVGAGHRATVAELFDAWKVWCEAKGRREPGTQATFGRDLLAAAPSLRRVRPRDGEERYRAYNGIAVRPI